METPFPEQINYLRRASKGQSGGAKSVVRPSIDAFPTPSLLRSNDDLTSLCGGALCSMHSAHRPTAVHGRFSQTKREAIELFVSFLQLIPRRRRVRRVRRMRPNPDRLLLRSLLGYASGVGGMCPWAKGEEVPFYAGVEVTHAFAYSFFANKETTKFVHFSHASLGESRPCFLP